MYGKTLVAILVFSGFMGAVVPAAAQDSGLYLGASIGAAKARQVCANASNCDEDETGYKGFVGYQFNKYLSAEGGYQYFSMFGRNSRGISVQALDVLAVGSYPVTKELAVYARAGAAFTSVKSAPAGEDTMGLTYSVGAEYSFSPTLGGRLDWQRYNNVGGGNLGITTDVDVLSAALIWRLR